MHGSKELQQDHSFHVWQQHLDTTSGFRYSDGMKQDGIMGLSALELLIIAAVVVPMAIWLWMF